MSTNCKAHPLPKLADDPHAVHKAAAARILLCLSVIWMLPTLACGSFAPRPTPTPTMVITPTLPGLSGESTPEPPATPTPLLVIQEQPTPLPAVPFTGTSAITATTATTSAAPTGGSVLAVGQPARITAPNGLNLRTTPSSGGTLLMQLATGGRVTILEGPTQAEGFTWWKVDDGGGNSGWVAQGDSETEWLSPQMGAPQAVNRAPRVGERVTISMGQGGLLSVRATPGTGATLITQVNPGAEFTVLAGPQSADGLTWFQIRSDDGQIEGWAADGDGTDRWISPLE